MTMPPTPYSVNHPDLPSKPRVEDHSGCPFQSWWNPQQNVNLYCSLQARPQTDKQTENWVSFAYLCDGEEHKPTHHSHHQYPAALCGRGRTVHAAQREWKDPEHQGFEVQGDSCPLPTPLCTSENSSLPTSPRTSANKSLTWTEESGTSPDAPHLRKTAA